MSGSISYWNIFFPNMTYIFLFTSQTYIFNFIIPFHRRGDWGPAVSNLPKIAWGGRGYARSSDMIFKVARLPHGPFADWRRGWGAWSNWGQETWFPCFFFFLTLYISTPMLRSADNAITCNLRKSSPALFRNNQKILLLISFCKNLYKLKVLL